MDAKGQEQLILGDEIEPVAGPDGKLAYQLTDEGVKDGLVRLQWTTGMYNERALHALLGQWVFRHDDIWGYVARPFYYSLAFFVLALFVAVPKDRARRMIWKHGRRLRGPELATTAEFNTKLGRSKGLRVHLPDGVAFVNEEQSWYDPTFHNALSRWARIPRDREAMHFLIVGDSGTGSFASSRLARCSCASSISSSSRSRRFCRTGEVSHVLGLASRLCFAASMLSALIRR